MAKGSLSVDAFLRLIKYPPESAPWAIWRAWMRRKLSLKIERAEKRILASVGMAA
jgi:hypothetical protein